jgi:hypothetical protein
VSVTDPRIAVRSHPVSFAQAIASVDERLLTPQWLPFASSGPTSVQQAVGDRGPMVTITRYEDPNSDEWVMIKQFHVGQFRQQGTNPLRQVTVDATPVALLELTVRAGGRATQILVALWTHRVTRKPFEVHSHGIAEDSLLQVVGSIK